MFIVISMQKVGIRNSKIYFSVLWIYLQHNSEVPKWNQNLRSVLKRTQQSQSRQMFIFRPSKVQTDGRLNANYRHLLPRDASDNLLGTARSGENNAGPTRGPWSPRIVYVKRQWPLLISARYKSAEASDPSLNSKNVNSGFIPRNTLGMPLEITKIELSQTSLTMERNFELFYTKFCYENCVMQSNVS